MSARSVLEHALAVYYGDSPDPEEMAGRLLGNFAAEVLAAAAPAPLTPERERELRTELHAAVRDEVTHFIETAGWQALELPLVQEELARHLADVLLPQVLHDARVVASASDAIAAAEAARGAAETERDARPTWSAAADVADDVASTLHHHDRVDQAAGAWKVADALRGKAAGAVTS